MVDDGGDTGPQEVVRDLVHHQHVGARPGGGGQPVPSGEQDRTDARAGDGVEHGPGRAGGVRAGHAAEPDEHRRAPGRQELRVAAIEVSYEDGEPLIALAGLRAPLRSGVSHPVVFEFERAGEVVVQVPVDPPDLPREPGPSSG